MVEDWGFTDETKSELRRILREGAPKEDILRFIDQLEWLCRIERRLRSQPSAVALEKRRLRVLKDCKAALEHLKGVGLGGNLFREKSVDIDIGRFHVPERGSDFLMMCDASTAVKPLEEFIKELEKRHGSVVKDYHKRKADSDHFAEGIKDLYIKLIGKPAKSGGGVFFYVVKEVREACGILPTERSKEDPACADPRRTVLAAFPIKNNSPSK